MSSSSRTRKKHKTGPPHRCGPRGWVTDSIYDHLSEQLPAFKKAQANGTLEEWWPNMHTTFAGNFPIAPLTEVEIAAGVKMEDKIRKQLVKIKTWFNNHARATQKRNTIQLLNLNPVKERSKKKLSLVQAYTRKYYPTKIKAVAQSRYAEHLKDVAAGLVKEIKEIEFRNSVIREFWKEEPEDVKKAIDAYRENRFLRGESSDEDESSDNEDWDEDRAEDVDNPKEKPLTDAELQAKEYNECQVAAQTVLRPILKELHERTGYVGALVLAAPDGARGGQLSTVSLFVGRTPQLLDWGQHYSREAWEEHVEGPLISFANLIYPPESEARKKFVMPGVSVHVSATGEASGSSAPSRSLSAAPSRGLASAATASRSQSMTPRRIELTCEATPVLETSQHVENGEGECDTRTSGVRGRTKGQAVEDEVEDDEDQDDKDDDEDDEELEPWKYDTQLSKAELNSIMAERSHYERNKSYNTLRHKRIFDALELSILAKEVVSGREPHAKGARGRPTNKSKIPDAALQSSTPAAYASLPSSPRLSATAPPQSADSPSGSPQVSPGSQRLPPSPEPMPLDGQSQQPHDSPRLPSTPGAPRLPLTPGSPRLPPTPGSPRLLSTPSSPRLPPSPGVVPPSGSVSRKQASKPTIASTSLRSRTNLATLRPSLADTHATKDRWPHWMSEIVRAVEHIAPRCGVFLEAMEMWVEFEDLMQYPNTKAKKNLLNSAKRPQEVTVWIKNDRKANAMPDTSANVVNFGKAWREWWASLQPESPCEPRSLSQYSELQKAGPNSLYLLFLSLAWWGNAAEGKVEEMISWRVAVGDFLDVVKFFNESLKESSGRKRPLDERVPNSQAGK
ncbi:hypothetical protein HWV62_20586 [Athelia sp. TMB]|nr:hypothetical protein HWV62_20586 [Athelia sp. TMB]